MGLFGRKKEDKPPAQSQGSFEAAVPPSQNEAVSNTEDMFGGLTSGTARRRKRTTTVAAVDGHADATVADTEATPSGSVPSEVPVTQPFFAKFEYQGHAVSAEDDVEADEVSQLRERLERFYTEYNPSKLAQIDSTIKSYKDRVPELFALLTEKYGPEPADPKTKLHSTAAAKSEEKPNKPSSSFEVARDTAGSGFTFGSGTDSAEGAVWGSAQTQEAGSGFHFDAPADPSTTAGFTFGGESIGGGAAGFTFGVVSEGADATAGFAFDTNAAATSEAVSGFTFGGAGDASAVEAPGGATNNTFQFAASHGSGFQFASDEQPAAQSGSAEAPADASDTVAHGELTADPGRSHPHAPSQRDATDTESDSDDEPTMNERHRKELTEAEGAVHEAKSHLATLVRELAEVVNQRRTLVATYRDIEERIQGCIQTEAFEEADQLNTSLERLGRELDAMDASESKIQDSVPNCVDAIRSRCRDLGSLLRRHRQELLEGKAEEERRVNKFITETSSKLDSQMEKLAASLDRANRTLHNTEQEVINIEQRSQKIQERINEQTKGMRQSHSALVGEKETLDAEIKELELKLQQKRRLSAEKKMKIGELEEKLKIIMDDFAVTVDEVQRQQRDEEAKRQNAQSIVDDLTQQEQMLLREQREFSEERDSMQRAMEQNSKKIEKFAELSTELSAVVPEEIAAYVEGALFSLLRARSAGKAFLVEAPHRGEISEVSFDGPSPVRVLTQLEATLQRCEKDQQIVRAHETAMNLRLQDIRKSIPLLEAAKKAAALSKQFKEAQLKTEELKRLHEESITCESAVAQSQERMTSIDADMVRLRGEIQTERRRVAKFMQTFLEEYRSALGASSVCVSDATVSQKLNLTRDDDFDVQTDGLRTSLSFLIQSLEGEATRLISSTESPGPAVDDDSTTAKVRAASTCSSNSQHHDVIVEDSTVEAEDSTVESLPVDDEAVREEIASLEAKLAAAMEDENYELCDAIQSSIDVLQAKLQA